MDKTVGIMGGMGPAATVDLFRKIVDLTPAESDQEHLHIIIDNNPDVPDRTEAILGGGRDPLPHLVEMAQNLEAAGADLLIMPCNTAHYFLPDLKSETNIPFLNMIDLTAARAAANLSPESPVGIMATKGTIAVKLYQEALKDRGLTPLIPEEKYLQKIMQAIYEIKERGPDEEGKKLIEETIRSLENRGARAIIAGCTELPLLNLDKTGETATIYDPAKILARKTIEEAKIPGV